ncbi:hypothetical protein FOZ60_015149 [Perkinsus olseni]|uniref:Uncharacterized protein n=2 Tax=Perkinsus olseni TaxID=32597 RepID=A0A7J6N6C1_PEROL|nr:hypothetical protein FOZ60_015149 [Perkinsus olseni]
MGGDISVFNRDYYDDRNDAVDTGRGHHARQGYYCGDGWEAVLILRHMRACPRRCIDHPRCGQKCLVLDQELYNSVPAFSLHGCCECLNPLVAARSELDHKRELLAGPPLPVPLHEIQGYLRECVRYFSCCNELIVIATVYACRFAENVCMRHWNWRIIVAVWEDYCLFLSNLQDCFIYLSKCGLIQLGAYGGGPPLYRLKKLEAFALAGYTSVECEYSVTRDSVILTASGDALVVSNVDVSSRYSTPGTTRDPSARVSPVSLQSLMLRRRGSRSRVSAGHRLIVPDEYLRHACTESIGCATRPVRKSWVDRCPSLCDPTAAELRRRSLDKGNPFVGNWAHSPPAEPMVSLRVLSTNEGMEASPKPKRSVGMLPGRAACL